MENEKSSLNMINNNSSTPFKMKRQSPVNDGVVSSSGDDFDVDYSGAEAVDLGNIPASEFTKAKKKLVEGYGGTDNPDYRMDKGDLYWNKEKGKIRSGYTEYPEDAGDIEPRYLGENWDN